MTEPIKVTPKDQAYEAIYKFWIKNDRPAYCRMTNATFMKLETDGMIVFIKIDSNDADNLVSTSLYGPH